MPQREPVSYFFMPPVNKPTGGVAVLWRMAAFLARAGHKTALVFKERGGWRPQLPDVPEVDFAALDLGPQDVWVTPEGWVNALAPGLNARARCLVYVQNWAYLFTGLPAGVDWRFLPVRLLAVSDPVAWFVAQSLGLTAPVLRPGIDLEVFAPPAAKPESLTVAYMPRKNKALAAQIMAIVTARGRFAVTWKSISGLDQAGVAQALRDSHAFLATGFPEGCPLPPLEAMACGAIPAGFAGLGGWDYMRQARPGGHVPECPLRPVAWEGNGFYVPDNDVMGAALALEKALELWCGGGRPLERVRAACAATAAAYGVEAQRAAVLKLWHDLEPQEGARPAGAAQGAP